MAGMDERARRKAQSKPSRPMKARLGMFSTHSAASIENATPRKAM
jgi:hypothetical protein